MVRRRRGRKRHRIPGAAALAGPANTRWSIDFVYETGVGRERTVCFWAANRQKRTLTLALGSAVSGPKRTDLLVRARLTASPGCPRAGRTARSRAEPQAASRSVHSRRTMHHHWPQAPMAERDARSRLTQSWRKPTG